MNTTIRALRVAEKMADGIPVPYVKSAISAALHIAQSVEDTKSTQDECRQLATRAARITLAIYEHLRTCPELSSQTSENVASLLCTLEEIDARMHRHGKKPFFAIFASKARVKKDVAELSIKLEDAFRVFNVQSSLHANEQLSHLVTMQSRLVCHADNARRVSDLVVSDTRAIKDGVQVLAQGSVTHDGTMRLFGRDDLDLLGEIGCEWSSLVSPHEQPVTRYRARLRQTDAIVVVRRFTRADDRFRSAVGLARKAWHPAIVQTLGISRPDPLQAFIVQESGTDASALLESLTGVERMTFLLRCFEELNYAYDFMEEYGMRRVSGNHPALYLDELLVGEDGTLRWDLGQWDSAIVPNLLMVLKRAYSAGSYSDDIAIEMNVDINSLTYPSGGHRSIMDVWAFVTRQIYVPASVHSWYWPTVPAIGLCYPLGNHKKLTLRYHPTEVLWTTSGPYSCLCKFNDTLPCPHPLPCHLEAIPEPQSVRCTTRSSEHGDSSLRGEVDYITSRRITLESSEGWKRHTVDIATSPVLAFAISTSGCSWRDASVWFCNTVLSDDVPPEVAADMFLVGDVYIHISTERILSDDPDEGCMVSAGSLHHDSDILYFFEDFGRPRTENTFEVPLGYWSRNPDDWPSPAEMADQRVLQETRCISFLGRQGHDTHKLVWEQDLGSLRFRHSARTEVLYIHPQDHERAVLGEIRKMGKDAAKTLNVKRPRLNA